MFRLWGKIYKKNKIIKDMVIENDSTTMSKEKMVDMALADMCESFDIQIPLWFENNRNYLQDFGRTSFSNDHFMESIDFDYLEIEIIEDEKKKEK